MAGSTSRASKATTFAVSYGNRLSLGSIEHHIEQAHVLAAADPLLVELSVVNDRFDLDVAQTFHPSRYSDAFRQRLVDLDIDCVEEGCEDIPSVPFHLPRI